jgi:hypothetical protein
MTQQEVKKLHIGAIVKYHADTMLNIFDTLTPDKNYTILMIRKDPEFQYGIAITIEQDNGICVEFTPVFFEFVRSATELAKVLYE